MKTWEIYHYTYGNVCDDEYYGKTSTHKTLGFVTDTEENVNALVDKLNERNHSYYAKDDEDYEYDEYDEDRYDEDYIAYRELKISTLDEIEHWGM